jgi:multidrug efflux pump subunit AcrA (membrane-fusion protein)
MSMSTYFGFVIASLAAVGLSTDAPAAATQQNEPVRATSAGAELQLPICYTALIDDIDVPARETGLLRELHITEGMLVETGATLASIDDSIVQRKREEAEAKLKAADQRAASTVELSYAEAELAVASSEEAAGEKLRAKGSMSFSEYQKLALEKRRAELQIEKTQNDLLIQKLSADAERAALASTVDAIERHRIVSPLDGNVHEIYKRPGEWIESGQAICRIVRMNRIRVQGFVLASQYDPQQLGGRAVTVVAELARGRTATFNGQIVHVGLEKTSIQDARYVVWAEVDNQVENGYWMLLPGSAVSMTIHLDRPAVASESGVEQR